MNFNSTQKGITKTHLQKHYKDLEGDLDITLNHFQITFQSHGHYTISYEWHINQKSIQGVKTTTNSQLADAWKAYYDGRTYYSGFDNWGDVITSTLYEIDIEDAILAFK